MKVLAAFANEIVRLPEVSGESAKATLDKVTASLGISPGKILQPLRMVITGGASGPDLMMTLEIIGKLETVNRITYALKTVKTKVPL